MTEYIDRNRLIKKFCGHCYFDVGEKNCAEDCYDMKIIKSLPIEDVQPVVRGHWIGTKEAEDMGDIMKEFTCSVCGCCEWDCTESESFNFCPNCGADMRGEK